MFCEPAVTRLDLRFSVSALPVRVHPMFWIVVFLLGWNLPVVEQLLWVAVVFVSILVHELGHSWTARMFGRDSRIVLYSMGGLTIPASHPPVVKGWRHALVAISGPAAGFALALVAYLLIPRLGSTASGVLGALYFHLVQVNVVWGLVNLFPIFPLDGGQVTRSVLTEIAGARGHAWASALSLVTAGAIAIVFWQIGRPLVAVVAGYFAVSEWQQST